MKIPQVIFVCLFLLGPSLSWAAAKDDAAVSIQIIQLKEDLKAGKIKIGMTRLKDIRTSYGEPINITNTDKKIVYDYGDLKIEFEKRKYWRSWTYDSFQQAAYTAKIDDLRYDLERRELTGDNITLEKIIKNYDQPTESSETADDGGTSTYYYGDIKMDFENVFVVKSWIGQKLDDVGSSASAATADVLSASTKPTAPPAATATDKAAASAKASTDNKKVEKTK